MRGQIGLIGRMGLIGLIIFSWDCVLALQNYNKKSPKNKGRCEVQIFVDGKLHQLSDNQCFNKMRYTDFLSDLG